MPAEIPVTNPLLFTVATAGLALLHVPKGVVLESSVVLPIQADKVPVIAFTVGSALMVTVVVMVLGQPFGFGTL